MYEQPLPLAPTTPEDPPGDTPLALKTQSGVEVPIVHLALPRDFLVILEWFFFFAFYALAESRDAWVWVFCCCCSEATLGKRRIAASVVWQKRQGQIPFLSVVCQRQ